MERQPFKLLSFNGPYDVLICMLAQIIHWWNPVHVETSCEPGYSASCSNGDMLAELSFRKLNERRERRTQVPSGCGQL